MPCEKHSGELVVPMPVMRPHSRIGSVEATIDVTICDKCGALFVPVGNIEKHKAAMAAHMLREESEKTGTVLTAAGAAKPPAWAGLFDDLKKL